MEEITEKEQEHNRKLVDIGTELLKFAKWYNDNPMIHDNALIVGINAKSASKKILDIVNI
jgi:hypothetical protein